MAIWEGERRAQILEANPRSGTALPPSARASTEKHARARAGSALAHRDRDAVPLLRRALRVVAPNLLDRDFTAATPNQRWVGDTSEFIVANGGRLFVAAIIDLFSRYCVGWATSAVNDRNLVAKALDMAMGDAACA